MIVRSATAIAGIAVFVWLCLAGALPFAIGVTVVSVICLAEYHVAVAGRAGRGAGCAVDRAGATTSNLNRAIAWIGPAFPVLVFSGVRASGQAHVGNALDTAYASLLGALAVLFAASIPGAGNNGYFARTRLWQGIISIAYIGMLPSGLVLLRAMPSAYGSANVTLLFAVCVWATDTGAYLVGRTLGQHKLAPSISPGKTVEGAVAGLVAAVASGILVARAIHLPAPHGAAIGAIAATVGQVGDLFESALKRQLGLKDFGTILPGHGGVLDRFDSIIFACPFAYLYLAAFTSR